MRKIIKTDPLMVNDIPDENAGWDEISDFALTFDSVSELGTTAIYEIEFMEFDEGSTLQELRRSLFLWQSGWKDREVDENGFRTFGKPLALIKNKITDQVRHE